MDDRAVVLSRRGAIRVVGGLVLGAGLLRLWGLGTESLWVDEAWSLWTCGAGLEHLLEQIRVDVHPPLYYLILNLWILVGGTSEIALRLPSVGFGLAAVPLVFFIGRRLFGQWAGAVAAGMLAISPFHVYFSQEARSYTLLVLLCCWTMHAFVGLVWRDRRRDRFSFALSAVLLLYTHYMGLFVIIAYNMLYLILLAVPGERATSADSPGDSLAALPRTRWQTWCTLQLGCGLLFLPALVLLSEQLASTTTSFWIPPPTLTGLGRSLLLLLGARCPGSQVSADLGDLATAGGVILLILSSLSLHRGLLETGLSSEQGCDRGRIRFATAAVVLLGWGAVPVLLAWTASLFGPHVFTQRNAIVALPALVLVLSAVLKRCASPLLKSLVLALLLAPPAANLVLHHRIDTKEQWRAAGTWVGERIERGDGCVFDAWFVKPAFDYYLGQESVAATVDGGCSERHPRLWLVRSHPRRRQGELEATLEDLGFRLSARRRWRGVEVALLVRRDDIRVLPIPIGQVQPHPAPAPVPVPVPVPVPAPVPDDTIQSLASNVTQ